MALTCTAGFTRLPCMDVQPARFDSQLGARRRTRKLTAAAGPVNEGQCKVKCQVQGQVSTAGRLRWYPTCWIVSPPGRAEGGDVP
jgi:hypothetical protein